MKTVNLFATVALSVSVTLLGSFEPAKAQESDKLNSANDAQSNASIYFGGGNSSGGGFEALLNSFGGAMVPSSGVYPGDTSITELQCSVDGQKTIQVQRATEESSTSFPFFSSSSSKVSELTPEQIVSIVQCLAWSDPASLTVFASSADDRAYVLAASMLLQVMTSPSSNVSLDTAQVQRYRPLVGIRLPEGSNPSQEMVDLAQEIFVHKWAHTAAQNRNN